MEPREELSVANYHQLQFCLILPMDWNQSTLITYLSFPRVYSTLHFRSLSLSPALAVSHISPVNDAIFKLYIGVVLTCINLVTGTFTYLQEKKSSDTMKKFANLLPTYSQVIIAIQAAVAAAAASQHEARLTFVCIGEARWPLDEG
jgi:hypothetical protein